MCVELGTSMPHHVTYLDLIATNSFFVDPIRKDGVNTLFSSMRTCVQSHPSGSAHLFSNVSAVQPSATRPPRATGRRPHTAADRPSRRTQARPYSARHRAARPCSAYHRGLPQPSGLGRADTGCCTQGLVGSRYSVSPAHRRPTPQPKRAEPILSPRC